MSEADAAAYALATVADQTKPNLDRSRDVEAAPVEPIT